MRKAVKNILFILLIFTFTVLLPTFFGCTDLFGAKTKAEDEAEWSKQPVEDSGSGGGTSSESNDSAFTILEIVPYQGCGEIGYLVGGQEPIDEKYLSWDMTGVVTGLTSNAISVYNSYEDEFMNQVGAYDKTGQTVIAQNGYFEYVKEGGSGLYALETDPSKANYVRVAPGQGKYKAVLAAEDSPSMIANYTSGNTFLNRRNVIAYFVTKPTSTALYTANTKVYKPTSVTEVEDNSGDYDYNCDTGEFILNKDHGDYQVIFTEKSAWESGLSYYMTNDYEIVDDNTGDYSWRVSYVDVGNNQGDYVKIPYSFRYEQWWGGNYKWVPSNNIPDELFNTQGYYREVVGGVERIWVKGQKVYTNYKYTYHVQLVNNEYLKRYSFGISGLEARDYPVKVITMTPSELNLEENKKQIGEADLIYINQSYHNSYGSSSTYIYLYENYSEEGRNLSAGEKYYGTGKKVSFEDNDLNWENVVSIFKRAAGINCSRAAVVMDCMHYLASVKGLSSSYNYTKYFKDNITVTNEYNGQVSATGTGVNLSKLYIMLLQRDTLDFYHAFMDPANPSPYKIKEVTVDKSVSPTGTTGSFVRPDIPILPKNADGTDNQAFLNAYTTVDSALYWNGNTFVPFGITMDGTIVRYTHDNISTYIPNYNLTQYTTNLNDNTLVMNGCEIFAGTVFISPYSTVSIPNSQQYLQALIHMVSVNPDGSVPVSFTIADIINIITNNGKGYGNNGNGDGGSGATDSEEDGTSGSNYRNYTSILNIQPTADFTESDNQIKEIFTDYENLKITNMTSEQFNCSILDMNTHFDAVYIGSSIGRFNTVTKNSVKSSVFNNDSLNGSVYFQPGDYVRIDGNSTLNYTGNDITVQKKTDLENFIQAGYPVIVAGNLYNLSGNTVNNAPNMKSFINETKSNINLLNADSFSSADIITKATFLGRLLHGMNILRPRILLQAPTVPEDSEVNYIYTNSAGELVLNFKLLPKKLSGYKYNAHLYLDRNEDGIFSDQEEIAISSKNGEDWNNIEGSLSWNCNYTMRLSGRNGSYQWKILVEQADNPNIRSEITGYTACTNRQTINILQIMDNHNTDNPNTYESSYSLEDSVNDSSSLIRQYGGFGETKLKDYDLKFTTMSVKEFTDQYKKKEYNSSNLNSSDYLADYHVLILDNQVDDITDKYGALSNIRDEIKKGLGVIFTKDSVNYSKQSLYLEPENFLFENQMTYAKISNLAKPKSDDPYFIFDFFASGFTEFDLKKEDTYHTSRITKTNEGADSQYPYKIGASINIAEISYGDDVTIDYNNSDKTPLIGWYSLSDSMSKTNMGIYSSSPNDVKNNYYLFNKGNLYYSGIRLHAADTKDNDDEIKLFINTIIACYKNTGRAVTSAPVITITDPEPTDGTITLTKADVGDKVQVPITFELVTNSTFSADLSILWNSNATADGDWNKTIYKVSMNGDQTEITDLSNITDGTYIVYIPVDALAGENKLTLSCTNKEGRTTTLDTIIKYTPKPLTVTIDNEDIVKNIDKGQQYLYIDIDYAEIDNETDYLDAAEDIRLEFTVLHATGNVSIAVTDETGKDISVAGNKIFPEGTVDESTQTSYQLKEKTVPEGSYYLYLPASVMIGANSRDITVTAEVDSSDKGSATVILLRRSLFQLD